MADSEVAGAFELYVEHSPSAFAITRGAEHTLIFVNAAFLRLTRANAEPVVGRPIRHTLRGQNASAMIAALDRAFRTGTVARDQRIEPAETGAPAWYCSLWPAVNENGQPRQLVIELRVSTEAELRMDLQREVAERMLVSALREHQLAADATASRRRATFLASEGRRLAESLDESATLGALVRMSLPELGAWCIVDTLDDGGVMRRLAIVHPDPAKQARVHELDDRWAPRSTDPFGIPAMMQSARPVVVADGIDEMLVAAAHDNATLAVLRELGMGPLLTVPLVIRGRLIGAVTFVAAADRGAYTSEDVELAEDLATRSAIALDNARLYGEAIALKTQAESASAAKSTFLGTMSHELRTPLNAIRGYVDLIDMGLRGPVTDQQHVDLARIRNSQQHLTALVNDVLNFVRVDSGRVLYHVSDVAIDDALARSVALVEPLLGQKRLTYDGSGCDAAVMAWADREKVMQIFVNLLSNAIKFTPAGGRVVTQCEATEAAVIVRMSDTGIGIPPDKLDAIFEPFMQVRSGLAGRDAGSGLGLAISRELARGMGGDLSARSVEGEGSTFTLTLPRSPGAAIAIEQ